ncbi:alpha/beta fold hydrolase [Deinococcus lacus]|uniref:Alpha/beta fold hydrolase n=1 Tax=Deinococcus lacus TaxID=392561 RepID=A0ABW1Y9Q2_9DEIO
MKAEAFTFQGATLRYRVLGDGPPLVLIHGLSGSSRWWRRNLAALSQEHRVYVLDLAGYGSAARLQRSLGVRDAATLIAAWLESAELREVTLVGHSMGGQIATHVATVARPRVRALVLACASGLLEGNFYSNARNLPRAMMTGRPSFIPVIMADALRAGPVNMVRNTLDLLSDSVAELLPELDLPTLVVWGHATPWCLPGWGGPWPLPCRRPSTWKFRAPGTW